MTIDKVFLGQKYVDRQTSLTHCTSNRGFPHTFGHSDGSFSVWMKRHHDIWTYTGV